MLYSMVSIVGCFVRTSSKDGRGCDVCTGGAGGSWAVAGRVDWVSRPRDA